MCPEWRLWALTNETHLTQLAGKPECCKKGHQYWNRSIVRASASDQQSAATEQLLGWFHATEVSRPSSPLLSRVERREMTGLYLDDYLSDQSDLQWSCASFLLVDSFHHNLFLIQSSLCHCSPVEAKVQQREWHYNWPLQANSWWGRMKSSHSYNPLQVPNITEYLT